MAPGPSFDVEADYRRYVDGRTREDGVRTFLASRGIELAEGSADDPAQLPTVRGLATRKQQLFTEQLARGGAVAFPSTMALLRRLRSSGIPTALVTSSRNSEAVLAAAGVSDLFDARVDGSDALALASPSLTRRCFWRRRAGCASTRPARWWWRMPRRGFGLVRPAVLVWWWVLTGWATGLGCWPPGRRWWWRTWPPSSWTPRSATRPKTGAAARRPRRTRGCWPTTGLTRRWKAPARHCALWATATGQRLLGDARIGAGQRSRRRAERADVSLAANLPYVAELAQAGKRSASHEVQVVAATLNDGLDEVLRLLRDQYLGEADGPDATFWAFADDHRQDSSRAGG